MIEIVSEKQMELEAQKKKEEDRKIVVDKTMKNGPFQIKYKPVKLNENEIKKLGLENGNLNLVTLAYVKEDGTKDEFVLGNLTNTETKDGVSSLSKDMKKFNSDIDKNYKITNSKIKQDDLNATMNSIKETLEEYGIQYTPESYEFFYDSQQNDVKQSVFVARKSVSVLTDSNNFNNLELYDDVKVKSLFDDEENRRTEVKQETTMIDDLKEYINTDEELAFNVKKVEEYKNYDEIAKYLEQLDTDEKVVKFFEDNPDILEHVASKRPEYRKIFENHRQGKTNVDEKAFAKIIFNAVISETKKDPSLMKMVIMPEKDENLVEQER